MVPLGFPVNEAFFQTPSSSTSCKWAQPAIVQVARGQLLHVLVAASVEQMDRFGAFEVWIPREPGKWRKEGLIIMSWVRAMFGASVW